VPVKAFVLKVAVGHRDFRDNGLPDSPLLMPADGTRPDDRFVDWADFDSVRFRNE